jgi:hypothetical protein
MVIYGIWKQKKKGGFGVGTDPGLGFQVLAGRPTLEKLS